MSAEVIQFVPKPRRTRPRLGPCIPVLPNAIEEVFQHALVGPSMTDNGPLVHSVDMRALTPSHPHEAAIQDTAPAELNPAS